MKGFIEVIAENGVCFLINVNSILRVVNDTPCRIITKEIVSRYECSGDNHNITTNQSYKQIKELIKSATEVNNGN